MSNRYQLSESIDKLRTQLVHLEHSGASPESITAVYDNIVNTLDRHAEDISTWLSGHCQCRRHERERGDTPTIASRKHIDVTCRLCTRTKSRHWYGIKGRPIVICQYCRDSRAAHELAFPDCDDFSHDGDDTHGQPIPYIASNRDGARFHIDTANRTQQQDDSC